MKTKVKKPALLKASEEFVVGKHDIGYVSQSFKDYFEKESFEARPLGTYKTLPRAMTDAEIEKELVTGLSTLGDILAFLENPPEESKNGHWNLFYTRSCVVRVDWRSGYREWNVHTWGRGGDK